MKVLSTNTATALKIDIKGKKVSTGFYKKPTGNGIFLNQMGVDNDYVADLKHHGGIDKACYLYGAQNYHFWKSLYPNLVFEYGMLGENITVDVFEESKINIGDIFKLGNAIIQVTQPRQPCFKLGFRFENQKIVKQFMKAPYPGAYVKVIQEGNVKSGDNIEIIETATNSISLSQAHELIGNSVITKEMYYKLMHIPELASSFKKSITEKFNKQSST